MLLISTICLIYFFQVFAEECPGMKFQVTDSNIADECFPKPNCNFEDKYRTLDGSCNNIDYPNWGKAGTPLVRLLSPNYADGNWSIPKNLPNARKASLFLYGSKNDPFDHLTTACSGWSQLIAHDASSSQSQSVNCCPNGEALEDDKCASVPLSRFDPDFGICGRTCMNIARTKTTQSLNCQVAPVQQVTQTTHPLDLSPLYGTSLEESWALRTKDGGLLETSKFNGKEFCVHAPKNLCDPRSAVCFKSGDPRINQNLELTSFHTLTLREHNRCAKILHEMNPSWTDEQVFQEARRIIIAEVQFITYYEFYPAIFGSEWTEDCSCGKGSKGDFTQYDPRINPSTINEFTAGCWRLLHTIAPGTNRFMTEDGIFKLDVPLKNWWERPDLMQFDFKGKIVGMTRQPLQKPDNNFVDGIHKFTEKQIKLCGDDLETIDLARGRDHGMPSYNDLRAVCTGNKASNFQDLKGYMTSEYIEKLSQLYGSVDKIELYPGTLYENKEDSSILGPTCAAVVDEQFRRWQCGDRFWFEHEGQAGSFTPQQLKAIRNTSLARMLCDNGEVSRMQPNAFRKISSGNPLLPCCEIPEVSLEAWRV